MTTLYNTNSLLQLIDVIILIAYRLSNLVKNNTSVINITNIKK